MTGCLSWVGHCTSLAAQQGTGLELAGFSCSLICCPDWLLLAASALPDRVGTFLCMALYVKRMSSTHCQTRCNDRNHIPRSEEPPSQEGAL